MTRGIRFDILFTASMVCSAVSAADSQGGDPRLREVSYDPRAVVTVPVKRGVVTLVVLDADEAITDVAAGLGGDCGKPEAAWCIAAQPGGRHFFVKPKSTASAPNNLAVVTDRRTHSFRFVVLADSDAKLPVYRLVVNASAASAPARLALRDTGQLLGIPAAPPPPSPQEVITERLQAKPQVTNARYLIAEGEGSGDIVPTLVFDDGRFTYLRFPGNREVPAVFHVLGDGSETLVNARMEEDLLVIDRVSRRLMLRSGSAVVGVWNDAFDPEGLPPDGGTTAPGVQRVLKADARDALTGQRLGRIAMTGHADSREAAAVDSAGRAAGHGDAIAPLPGESGIPEVTRRSRNPVSTKGLLAVGLSTVSLVAVTAFSIHRFASSGKTADDGESKRVGDRPTAATAEPRRLDMTVVAASAPRIPALVPTAQEVAEPIGVRRTGQGGPAAGGAKPALPEDAPVLLVTSRPGASAVPGTPGTGRPAPTALREAADRGPDEAADPGDPMAATTRNLQGYQQQLQGLLDSLTRSTAIAAGQPTAAASVGAPDLGGSPSAGFATGNALSHVVPSGGGLFGGQLQGSATPRVAASVLAHRSLTLPKGTAFTCALKTKVISATSGFVGCQVQRNVFGDDGRVLLVERGSHLDGEYRIASVRPGTVRIPVLWTRIRTPNGVTVDLDSPATGSLGESGIEGFVDNRWLERIGAAMLLSLIDDSVKLVIQAQSHESQGNTVVLPSTTGNTSKLAEKVLDSTINIPPLIYQNQGGIVGIYVARDVDFSSVYELKPSPRDSIPGEPR